MVLMLMDHPYNNFCYKLLAGHHRQEAAIKNGLGDDFWESIVLHPNTPRSLQLELITGNNIFDCEHIHLQNPMSSIRPMLTAIHLFRDASTY